MKNSKQTTAIPPGEFGLPLIRENIKFVKNPDVYTLEKSNLYGDVFKTHILGNPTIIVKGRQFVEYILNNENKYFVNDFPSSLKQLIGNSLATQYGDLHGDRRKVLSKLFQFKNLNKYHERLEEITLKYFKNWTDLTEINLYENIRKYCFDIAGEYLLGTKELSSYQIFYEYNTWSKGMFSIPLRLPFTNFGKAFAAKENIKIYIVNLIKNNEIKENSLLKILLDHNINEDEIIDQTLMMLYAGHGTLASLIWSLCYQFGHNPHELEEYRKIANNSADKFEKYTEAVVRECLRIAPPVGGGFRKVIKDNEAFGYFFPKGWSVFYQIRETELDNRQYHHPLSFDPRRQLGLMDTKILAFGGGARECIGRELAKNEVKIFAKVLASKYDIKIKNINEIQTLSIPTIHPKNIVRASVRVLS